MKTPLQLLFDREIAEVNLRIKIQVKKASIRPPDRNTDGRSWSTLSSPTTDDNVLPMVRI